MKDESVGIIILIISISQMVLAIFIRGLPEIIIPLISLLVLFIFIVGLIIGTELAFGDMTLKQIKRKFNQWFS